ncbi:MAG: hypothetical protein PWP14_1061 [Methanolobus sp.]|jgi:hypothetical protein|nr:hypothetical protein [Methanolobus sp.]MDN5309667.1 hypothetical protein [Methanolobus sp.]
MRKFKTWTKKSDFGYAGSGAVQDNDEDADYKPILRGVINTRCNYDGGKIEGTMEEF